MDFISPIAKVKGLGTARSGTSLFIHQRLTALFLIPLMVWMVVSIIMIVQHPFARLPIFIVSPVNISICLMLIFTFVYHGVLGMQVVIEDYVSCKTIKNMLLATIYFISILSVLVSSVAIIQMHVIFRLIEQ